jgi:hypothetical protein
MWSAYGYHGGPDDSANLGSGYPSLSTTSVGSPADTIMITQANEPDLEWHQDNNPDEAGRYWGDPPFNLWGDANATSGPAGRIGTAGEKAGVYPTSNWEPTQFPEGINVSCYTDGHAKAELWRSLNTRFITLPSGVKYLKWAAAEQSQ